MAKSDSEKGMKQKILKPRKGRVEMKGLVIMRIKWLKIRNISGQRKMMIIMGMIMLIGYTMMTMRGPKVINTWEKFTRVRPNPKTKKGSKGKRNKIAKE